MGGMSTATSYPDSPIAESFEKGLQFQDFVCLQLAKEHIILQNMSSKKQQIETGENLQGFEIKLDQRCTDTNRLSVEVAEKSRADMPVWTPSGIYRSDNTWLYIQGNYEILFIFALNVLHRMHKRCGAVPGVYEHEPYPTLRAFFLPFDVAERNAAKVIRP